MGRRRTSSRTRKGGRSRKTRRKSPSPLLLLLAAAVLLLGAAGAILQRGELSFYTDSLERLARQENNFSDNSEYSEYYENLENSDYSELSPIIIKDFENSDDSPADTADVSALTVHFLDVGQGDSTLLTVGDSAMLIDAGDNDAGETVQSYLTYLGIETLDYLVLTHPDADHIGGADTVICALDCEVILMPELSADSKTYEDVIDAMEEKAYTASQPAVGESFSLGTASFTILSPDGETDDRNNASLVLRLTYGELSFLFTGDAEEEAEEAMLASGQSLASDVLKVGHHGSRTSTSDAFLAAVSPSFAVISCGEGNSYGHPHAETLNKLRAAGISVYRTDEQGTVTVTSDGSALTWNASPSETWQSGG